MNLNITFHPFKIMFSKKISCSQCDVRWKIDEAGMFIYNKILVCVFLCVSFFVCLFFLKWVQVACACKWQTCAMFYSPSFGGTISIYFCWTTLLLLLIHVVWVALIMYSYSQVSGKSTKFLEQVYDPGGDNQHIPSHKQ